MKPVVAAVEAVVVDTAVAVVPAAAVASSAARDLWDLQLVFCIGTDRPNLGP